MRLYLDTCCYNRPFDDRREVRVRMEAEAVLLILAPIAAGAWILIGSDILDLEISRTPDEVRRRGVTSFATLATERISVDEQVVDRATELRGLGFRPADALHLACAEKGRVDVLLTTDARFLRAAERSRASLQVAVRNPYDWFVESDA